MTLKQEVNEYLRDLKVKMEFFGILFLDDRSKNQQTLLELGITPSQRKEIINSLKIEDYSQGPLDDIQQNLPPMWVFGKLINNREVYIKVSLGIENSMVVCISFHFSEYPMKYPLKNN